MKRVVLRRQVDDYRIGVLVAATANGYRDPGRPPWTPFDFFSMPDLLPTEEDLVRPRKTPDQIRSVLRFACALFEA